MGGTEQKYVQEAFDTNWLAPLGPNVNAFEKELCAFTGAGYAAALSSGTAAMHLAMILTGVGQGDEVICQSFTFSASANPIVYQGATPVFIDSEPETWNLDPEILEHAIKERLSLGKKVKAIVAVDLYGMPAKMDEVTEISARYGIPVIQDAAEAMGATYKGRHAGTGGLFGIFSFNGNKIITTTGGGALVSHDRKLIDRARFLSTQARDEAPHYQHTHIGYNYRMSNVLAGIGRGQLHILPQHVESRRRNFERYTVWFDSLKPKGYQVGWVNEPEGSFANRWLTTILIDPLLNKGLTRDKLHMAFLEDNIETRPLWKPMHLQPVFRGAPYYGNGTSERLFNYGLCLPSGSNLKEAEFQRIFGVLGGIFR
jgi:dTDP-4-amino-4,6-dideoxygalactose transaminase